MECNSVLFACDFFGPNPGNFIPSLTALEAYITQANLCRTYRVVYAFPEKCREFAWCQEMLSMGKTLYFYQNNSTREKLRFLEEIKKKEHVVLIHVHFEALGRAIYLFKMRNPKIPVIWHKHNDFSLGRHSLKSTVVRRIKDFFIDRLMITVAVSPHLKTPRGYVLLNHLVTSRLPEVSSSERRNGLRHQLQLSDDDLLILMFGWNKLLKGVDIACKMLEYLPERLRRRCKLAIVLADNEENRSYVIQHCQTPENVFLLKSTDDVFSYHCAADIMLSAARSEAFAYTILEALSVGVPVVSSDIPGVQWSRSYPNVTFFESQNPEDCAHAIENCVDRNNHKQNTDIAVQVRADYSIDKWCVQILEIYIKTGAVV